MDGYVNFECWSTTLVTVHWEKDLLDNLLKVNLAATQVPPKIPKDSVIVHHKYTSILY